mmetsp:Transcript_3243/g.5033  ORF Transcript_3243/g.5033 Transcript_3243/m.5033 type:complete len:239 (+) Transcript_3243:120-836(+)
MAWAASADDNPFADPSVKEARNPPGGNLNNTPAWLRTSNPPPPPPPANQSYGPPQTSSAAQQAPPPAQDLPSLMIFMRLINIGLCALLCTTAALSLVGAPNFKKLVLAIYLFAFACILCCFETHIKYVATLAAANFGFLYDAKGRAIFLFFIGILCISFGSILGYLSAVCMIVDAFFNFYVIWKYPEIEANQQRKDLESQSKEFARNNQAAIARHGVSYAQNNPQQAAQAVKVASAYV